MNKVPKRRKSSTGEFQPVEDHSGIDREPMRPTTIPEMPPEIGGTTGIMPIYNEPADDTADRESDIPDGHRS